MPQPIIASPDQSGLGHAAHINATGSSFSVHEWRGSGPATLHVHHADDEAWHVLEGTIHFRFADHEVDVPAGGTVFVPAGVAHTYTTVDARYLIILTPRLSALIAALHATPDPTTHAAIYRQYQSELLD